jgi:hypothetical protein
LQRFFIAVVVCRIDVLSCANGVDRGGRERPQS